MPCNSGEPIYLFSFLFLYTWYDHICVCVFTHNCSPPYILVQISQWSPELNNSASLANEFAQGPHVSASWMLGLEASHHRTSIDMVPGTWAQVLKFVQNALYPLGHPALTCISHFEFWSFPTLPYAAWCLHKMLGTKRRNNQLVQGVVYSVCSVYLFTFSLGRREWHCSHMESITSFHRVDSSYLRSSGLVASALTPLRPLTRLWLHSKFCIPWSYLTVCSIRGRGSHSMSLTH